MRLCASTPSDSSLDAPLVEADNRDVMAYTVWKSFEDFKERLEPTNKQKEDASTKRGGVMDALNKKLWVSSAFLTGSYGRSTMIRPPSDIDLFVVLDADRHANQYYYAEDGTDQVLARFHSILKDAYPYTPIRKDHPAIHLDFTTYGFDVVPAFVRSGGGYLVLNRHRSGWISTDPTKHAARTTLYNSLTDGYFVRCVKMLKSCNRDKNYSRLSGFHLEVECGYAWPRTEVAGSKHIVKVGHFAEGVAGLLNGLANTLATPTDDPAKMSGRIDGYLTDDVRRLTRETLRRCAESANYALIHEKNDKMEWAIGRWRDALGDTFPTYG